MAVGCFVVCALGLWLLIWQLAFVLVLCVSGLMWHGLGGIFVMNFVSIFAVWLSVVSLVGSAGAASRLEITLDDSRRGDLGLHSSHFYTLQNRVNFNLFESGQGVVWDFSGMGLYSPNVIKIDTQVVSCKDTPYQASFPRADYCLVSNNDYGGTGAKIFYYRSPGVLFGQVTVVGKNKETVSNCDVVEDSQFSMVYGKQYGITLNCVNGSKERIKTHMVGEVVGEGTLILPNGKRVENVLRVRSQLFFGNKKGELKYTYYSKDAGVVLQSIGDSYVVINNYRE